MNNPEEVTKLENDFAEEIKKRGDDFKYFKDQDSCRIVVDFELLVTGLLSSESIPRREPQTTSSPRS